VNALRTTGDRRLRTSATSAVAPAPSILLLGLRPVAAHELALAQLLADLGEHADHFGVVAEAALVQELAERVGLVAILVLDRRGAERVERLGREGLGLLPLRAAELGIGLDLLRPIGLQRGEIVGLRLKDARLDFGDQRSDFVGLLVGEAQFLQDRRRLGQQLSVDRDILILAVLALDRDFQLVGFGRTFGLSVSLAITVAAVLVVFTAALAIASIAGCGVGRPEQRGVRGLVCVSSRISHVALCIAASTGRITRLRRLR
jgi:hypothetical protein